MNNTDIAIEAKGLHVSFLVQSQGINSIKQFLFSLGKAKMFTPKKVIKGIDITIKKGECFGLVGTNGSGKSTLLRTLAGVIPPDQGTINVNGRLAPMLALGAGLEMEMSGRENIVLCCTLMGLSQKEIKDSMQNIIDFSELGESIEMQVKRYSSGMMARLAFSMVVATDPDILIVDEALAVGDHGFQQKCMNKINEIKAKGTTIIYVSHSESEVLRLCDRAAWIKEGKVEMIGDCKEVVENYMKIFN